MIEASGTCKDCEHFDVKVMREDVDDGFCYGWIERHCDENGHVTHRSGERRWVRSTDACERYSYDIGYNDPTS